MLKSLLPADNEYLNLIAANMHQTDNIVFAWGFLYRHYNNIYSIQPPPPPLPPPPKLYNEKNFVPIYFLLNAIIVQFNFYIQFILQFSLLSVLTGSRLTEFYANI